MSRRAPRSQRTRNRKPSPLPRVVLGLLAGLVGLGAYVLTAGSAAAAPTCSIFWTGAAGSHAWESVGNWSKTNGGTAAPAIPTAADVVCMSTSPVSAAVTLTSAQQIAAIMWPASGSVSPALTLSGGTLRLGVAANTSIVRSLSFSNGSELDGPGTLTIPAGGTVTATGLLRMASGLHLINRGQGRIAADSGIIFDGSVFVENAGTLTLERNSALSSFEAGDRLSNDAGATIITSTSGPYAVDLALPFDNAGTVKALTGTLNLRGNSPGVRDAGTITTSAGAVVSVASGVRTFGPGASMTGAGLLTVSSGAELDIAGNDALAGVRADNGGTLRVAAGFTATTTSLRSAGTLAGPGTVTVNGPLTLDGDTRGTTNLRLISRGTGGFTAGSAMTLSDGATVENAGSFSLANGSGFFISGAGPVKLVNDASATLTYVGAPNDTDPFIAVPLDNAGTLSSTGASTVFVFGGNSPAGKDTGTFTTSAGSAIEFSQGVRTFGAGARVAGPGTVIVGTGADIRVNANSPLGNVQVSDGTLSVAAGITGTATSLRTGGSAVLKGPGTVTIPVGGTLTLADSPTLQNSLHLINRGTGTVIASATVIVDGASTIENAGTLTLQDSAGFGNSGDGTSIKLTNDAGAIVSYPGTDPDANAVIELPFTNQGTIQVARGILFATQLTNLANGTLTGGTYNVTGTLTLRTSVTRNSATIILGATGTVMSDETNSNGLTALAANTGTLQLGHGVTSAGPFTNSGAVRVNTGTFQVGTFTQTAGTTTVAPGAFLKAAGAGTPVMINGGTLTGVGRIVGVLTNKGVVKPTGGVGPLTVTASYTQSGGTLSIAINGSAVAGTNFGQLSATGPAALSGTLNLVLAAGYDPAVGTKYTILKASAVTGRFTTVTGTALAGRGYAVTYLPTSVVVTIAATPVVSGVSPKTGPPAGGTTVTITGTGFSGATGVAFSGSAATNVVVQSGTSITAKAPAHAAGVTDIRVTGPGGTSAIVAADKYTYTTSP